MRHLIIICNLESTNYDDLCTSSSKYELRFAYEMAKKVDVVSVVSPRLFSDSIIGNIRFYSCKHSNLVYKIKEVMRKVKKLTNPSNNTVVMTWGYNPILINAICKLKASNIKAVTMVYDTHLGELSNKTILKKSLIKWFYDLGIMQLNRVSGVILFKEKAKEHLRLKVKSCVVLPSINLTDVEPFKETNNDNLVFLYSGTLCEYNGLEELISAFKRKSYSCILEIYGDGPLKESIEYEAINNDNIVYGGRISNKELSEKIRKADVLINLRKETSIVNDFAYPSKVVEYMAYSKIIMSTNISEHEEFKEAVYLLKDLNPETIDNMIWQICNSMPEEFKYKVDKAEQYLRCYHDNKCVFKTIYNFMFNEIMS